MALVWQCDRCRAVSGAGNEDDPPDDWHRLDAPVRGSGGAKSTRVVVLCAECDDDLYRWFTRPEESP
jgi:hypothetical protein